MNVDNVDACKCRFWTWSKTFPTRLVKIAEFTCRLYSYVWNEKKKKAKRTAKRTLSQDTNVNGLVYFSTHPTWTRRFVVPFDRRAAREKAVRRRDVRTGQRVFGCGAFPANSMHRCCAVSRAIKTRCARRASRRAAVRSLGSSIIWHQIKKSYICRTLFCTTWVVQRRFSKRLYFTFYKTLITYFFCMFRIN